MTLKAIPLLLILAAPLRAEPAYFCIVYAEQAPGPRPPISSTHVFAVWLKLEGSVIVERVVFNFSNRGHEPITKAIAEAHAARCVLVRWILRTDATFFEMARQHKATMPKRWRLTGQGLLATNCTNAVSGVAGFNVGLAHGIPGGQVVVNAFVRRGLATASSDFWVADLVEAGR